MFCKIAKAESVAIAQVAQPPAQRKIKCAYRIVRPRISFIEPIINCAFAVPAFADRIRIETTATAQGAQLLNRPYHPTAVTFDHVIAESIEANFFQEPAGIVDEFGINQWRAMTKVRHVTESGTVPGLVLAGMKASPIARKFGALRVEFRPA